MTTEAPAPDGPSTPWYEMPHGMEREIAKYDQCDEPGDCDHDHDNAIEYFREQELDELRAQLSTANRLAEIAARTADRLRQHAERYRDRAESAEAEVTRLTAREAVLNRRNAETAGDCAAITQENDDLLTDLADANERARQAGMTIAQLLEINDLLRVDVVNAHPDREALADDAIQAHEENFRLRAWLDELGYDTPAVDKRLRNEPAAMEDPTGMEGS